MGILHKLWDETLAGPTPDAGLGKLRKFYSINGSNSSVVPGHDNIAISRSITVLRNNPNFRNLSVHTSSASLPDSPLSSSSSPSVSTPFTPGTPQDDQIQRLTWRKTSAETLERAEPRTPTVYDWIVISALDR
ncbi:dormancy-associated protein homolog 4 [Euphorbia lathyris]|uniref:dormancy-associated protein homolog 4 n=1 Tax=Euphorbia lathyris TaxID=212925 RepID=UPI003313A91A